MTGQNDIVRTSDRPDLVPIVAGWLWQAFWRDDGYTLDQTTAAVMASATQPGLPHTFILLVDGVPVGTASLAAEDLDERPHLTPWLAGVFVVPEARGRGYARRLVEAVERVCQAERIPAAWLYTNTAEALYARVGWHRVEVVQREGKAAVVLMRRDFGA